MISTSIIVTMVTVFGSVMGFLVQMLMAKHYGAGIDVDTYLYAIGSPTFFSGMVAALFSYTVVPQISKSSNFGKERDKLIASIILMSIVGVVFLLMTFPLLIEIQKKALPLNSGILSLKYIDGLLTLGWCISVVQILLSLTVAVLIGLKKPIFASILNLGPYMGMLSFIFVMQGGNILGLAWGMLVGTATSFGISLYVLRLYTSWNLRNIAFSELGLMLKKAPYTLMAMSCFSVYVLIDSYWAPRAGIGVLASLGYSQRLVIALGNLAVAGPSAVFVPRLSELIVQNKKEEFEKLLIKVLLATLFIVSLLAVSLYINGDLIIGLLFMRGSFNQSDVTKVAEVLQYCLPGMVCMLLTVICLRVLFCFNNIERKAAFIGLLWASLYFTFSGLLLSDSGKGIAMAYSVAWFISFLYSVSILFRSKNKQFLTATDPGC